MMWWRKMRVRMNRHAFMYGLANILFWLGVVCLILGVVLWSPLGWAGLGLLILGLVTLAWSDNFLPEAEEKERNWNEVV